MKELRTIIFDQTEVAVAMVAFCRRAKRKMPRGTLKGFTLFEDARVVGVLAVVDDYGEVHEISFNQEEIAAALVNHCLTHSIPLPRGASKMITAVDAQIVLAFEIGHASDVKQLLRAGTSRS